jgi:flagellar FliL protein
MAKTTARPVKIAAAPAPDSGEQPAAKGANKKKLTFLAVAATVLIGAGAGAWFYTQSASGESAGSTAARQAPSPPVFVNLEAFTANLQPESGADQYLQVVTVLKMSDDGAAEVLKQYMPELRHRMLLLLSSKRASELAGPEGRAALAEQMRAEANRIVASATGRSIRSAAAPIVAAADATGTTASDTGQIVIPGGEPAEAGPAQPADEPVQGVLFTSFIIQ